MSVPTSPVRSADPDARLVVEAAQRRFGGVVALAGVDLRIRPREILGLIGPNGSGKTTLVNCVSGFLRLDAGRIELAGVAITDWSRVRRAKAGIARTYQNIELFKGLSVRENVEVALNAQPMVSRRRHVGEQLLVDFELEADARSTVAELPYGVQRRVEIARALASQPSVLLLDEPGAGLNDVETAQLLATLHRIREAYDCSMLLIDHDMELVINASDRVQAFDEGRVIFDGRPVDALQDPQVIASYLGAA